MSDRIVILTRELDRGGAQRQISVLALGLKRAGYDVSVVQLYSNGAFEAELSQNQIPIISLEKQGRWDNIGFLFRLISKIRQLRPFAIYSFLTVPNILTALIKPLLKNSRIIWGIRASDVDLSQYDWLSKLTASAEAALSPFADCIICNSTSGRSHILSRKFSKKRILVIPNGIDSNYFQFDAVGRRHLRSEWSIDSSQILIGIVARLDPMKDHITFLEAASLIAARHPEARFICIGDGNSSHAHTLRAHSTRLGLDEKLIWSSSRDDMPIVYSAIDILVSSSAYGEGFSNTVAEAMSCSVPCVVTDVGDSAYIVGSTGSVVQARHAADIANALSSLITLPEEKKAALGDTARDRIRQEFSTEKMVARSIEAIGIHQ